MRSLGNRSPSYEQAGFTLLEVIIAMAIMVIAFTAILSVQSNSIRTATRARQLNTVTMLARNAMIETELEIEGKSFTEISKTKNGAFAEPYQDITWEREIKEIEFPSLVPGGGGGNEQGGGATDQFLQLLTNFLSQAVREVTVTIKWKKGSGEQKYSITTYWVDLNHEFQLSI